MIARVEVDGNYYKTIDANGRTIKTKFIKNEFLVNSSEIVVSRNGNYIEVFDEDLKKVKSIFKKFDRFLGASGDTFSIQNGNYAETYDKKGKKLSQKFSK
ncbi:hypothetical protein GO491_05030 [Flavobacteriaceae bacterium Ap0902]|nr:hypothetical protein [Flavobacteriaceae bacterium Ap0902]